MKHLIGILLVCLSLSASAQRTSYDTLYVNGLDRSIRTATNAVRAKADSAKASAAANTAALTSLTATFANDGLYGVTTSLPISADLRVFHHTKTANAGDPIFVQGAFPAGAVLNIRLRDGISYALNPIGNQQANAISAVIPGAMRAGMYTLFVSDGTSRTADIYINRAEGWYFDSPDVVSGVQGSIIGQNLSSRANTQSTVRLVSVTGAISTTAAVNASLSDDYRLYFTAPASLTVGQQYLAYISNGMGSTAGEVLVDDTLTAIASTTNVLGLGVAWEHRYGPMLDAANVYNIKTDMRLPARAVGNGTTNERQIIQDAIDYIGNQTAGGVLYFPPGNFKSASSGFLNLELRSKVIIRGAGPGSTTLTYGTDALRGAKALSTFGTSRTGIMDMTIVNGDETNSNGTGAGLFADASYFAIRNIVWDIRNGEFIEVNFAKATSITNSKLAQGQTNAAHPVVNVNGCRNVDITANEFTIVYGIGVSNCTKSVIDNNVVNRDVARGRNGVVHLWVIPETKKMHMNRNRAYVVNGPIPPVNQTTLNPNDGEWIVAEDPEGTEASSGTVTAATTNTLSDNTKAWPSSATSNAVVTIIRGKGVGQWRRIGPRGPTSFTVTTAWDVIPDATSQYCINHIGLSKVNIVNNSAENQQRGWTDYWTWANQVNVVRNTLTNSGSIDRTGIYGFDRGNGGYQFTPCFNYRIAYNNVNSLTDPNQGAFIGIHVAHGAQNNDIPGVAAIGFQVVGNTLTVQPVNKDVLVDTRYPNGYFAYHEWQVPAPYITPTYPVIWGAIFQNNTAINSSAGFLLNAGAHLTSFKNNTFIGVPTPVQENTKSPGVSVKTTNY